MSVELFESKNNQQILDETKTGYIETGCKLQAQDDIARQAYLIKKENENKLKKFIQARKLEYEKCRVNATRNIETENVLILSHRGDKNTSEVTQLNRSTLKDVSKVPQSQEYLPEEILNELKTPQKASTKDSYNKLKDASELRQKLEQNRNAALAFFIEKRQRALTEGVNRLSTAQEHTKPKIKYIQESKTQIQIVEPLHSGKTQDAKLQILVSPSSLSQNSQGNDDQNRVQEQKSSSVLGKENNKPPVSRGRELLPKPKKIIQKTHQKIRSQDVSVDDMVKQMQEEINSQLQKMSKFESLNRSKEEISSPESTYRVLERPESGKKELEIDAGLQTQAHSTKKKTSSVHNKLPFPKTVRPVTKKITLTIDHKENFTDQRNQGFLTEGENSVNYETNEWRNNNSRDAERENLRQKRSEKTQNKDRVGLQEISKNEKVVNERYHNTKKEYHVQVSLEKVPGESNKGFHSENIQEMRKSDMFIQNQPIRLQHFHQPDPWKTAMSYPDQVMVHPQLSPSSYTLQYHIHTPGSQNIDYINIGAQPVFNHAAQYPLNYSAGYPLPDQPYSPHQPLRYHQQVLNQQYQADDFMNNQQKYNFEQAQVFSQRQQSHFISNSKSNNKIMNPVSYESETIKYKIKEQEDFLKRFQANTHSHLEKIREERRLLEKIKLNRSPEEKTRNELPLQENNLQNESIIKEPLMNIKKLDPNLQNLASRVAQPKRSALPPEKWVKAITFNGSSEVPADGNSLTLSDRDDWKIKNRRARWHENGRRSKTASEDTKYPKSETFEVYWNSSDSCERKETLAEAFRKNRRDLVEKLEQEKFQYSKGAFKSSKCGKRTKEELLRQRKMMMEYRGLRHRELSANCGHMYTEANSLTKVSSPKSLIDDYRSLNEESRDQKMELLDRLVSGKKAQLVKGEMYDLTNKKFEQLPEVKQKREEEKKREQLRMRKERVKELDQKLRTNAIRVK